MSGAIGAALVSAAANMFSNRMALQGQKSLNRAKYADMIDYAKRYGATPTSIISGITGSAGGNMPSVSTSNNPMPNLGDVLNQSVSAHAAQDQAAAAKEQAAAATTNAETQRQLGLMRLLFEPRKYQADIAKALSEAFMNNKHAFLHGSMKQYYDELTEDIRQVRPWKIAGLKQGLLNDMATYDKILQETKTSRAQEGYFNAASVQAYSQASLNRGLEEEAYQNAMNAGLLGFRLQWQNTLLSNGIDVNRPFWENTGRLMISNPRLFKERMSMFTQSLNAIDERLQENLGTHYKRNIGIGVGLYHLNRIHQQNANARSYRFGNAARAISSFIPFAGGFAGSASLTPTPTRLPWYLEDGVLGF